VAAGTGDARLIAQLPVHRQALLEETRGARGVVLLLGGGAGHPERSRPQQARRRGTVRDIAGQDALDPRGNS
jgi:hypothetical protein